MMLVYGAVGVISGTIGVALGYHEWSSVLIIGFTIILIRTCVKDG